MRQFPTDSDELNDVEKLNAEQWQIDLLKLNPSYVSWGCYEDYMSNDKDGWDKRVITSNWKEHDWNLDEYNELVNFYFEVYRKSHNCPHCEGSNLNPATRQLSDAWYSFDTEDWIYPNGVDGRRFNNAAWQHHLTEVEVEALVKRGRLWNLGERAFYDDDKQIWLKWVGDEKVECDAPTMPTPQEVNDWNKRGFGHDSINQWICVKARAKHLGIYGHCEHCEEGVIYDENKARVGIQLWYLHPRKGCSRGVYIEAIDKEDIDGVLNYLREARDRNNERFSKI